MYNWFIGECISCYFQRFVGRGGKFSHWKATVSTRYVTLPGLCQHAQETWVKICRKFFTISCTITTVRPITLLGSCHLPDSFCPGIELCSIVCKKLAQDDLGSQAAGRAPKTTRLPRPMSGIPYLEGFLFPFCRTSVGCCVDSLPSCQCIVDTVRG